MNKLNICIDIDGTITSPYHFIPYLNELYNKNITIAKSIINVTNSNGFVCKDFIYSTILSL
mgnify:CR=1 FL=1